MKFIDTYKALKFLTPNHSENIISGTYHIHQLLLEYGYEPTNPSLLVDYKKKNIILDITENKLKEISIFLETLDIEDCLKAILLANCAKKIFQVLGKSIVSNNIENLNLSPSLVLDNLKTSFNEAKNYSPRLNNISPLLIRLNDGYHLDFCSRSGRELDKSKNKLTISAHADNFNGFANFFSNTARSLFTTTKRLRIDVASSNINSQSTYKHLNDQILHCCKQTIFDYFIHKHSLTSFLKNISKKPSKARFNNVGNSMLAGYVSALKDYDIPVELASHGAMIVHGTKQRKFITSILANSVYNYFPEVKTIIPRSPLQVTQSKVKIEKIIRTKPIVKKQISKKFIILYAPNFLPWHSCYHGLVPSCFETVKCAKALIEICKKTPELELNIRFKTTVKDIAKISNTDHNRGILPSDINGFYDNKLGIYDASLGSHSSLLENADLVISEGITAVLFEALEHRKPLLLLNEDKNRAPSLPAIRYNDLLDSDKRFAVYQSGIDETLQDFLMLISKRHSQSNLSDKELEDYIWTS